LNWQSSKGEKGFNPFNSDEAVFQAVNYLRKNYAKFQNNKDAVKLAVVSYNRGEGFAADAIRNYGDNWYEMSANLDKHGNIEQRKNKTPYGAEGHNYWKVVDDYYHDRRKAPQSMSLEISPDEYDKAEALPKLLAAGFVIESSGNDSNNRMNSSATTLDGIKKETVKGIIHLRSQLDLSASENLRITGGTEIGHAKTNISHWNGYKIDIGDDRQAKKIIKFAKEQGAQKDRAYGYKRYIFTSGDYQYTILDEKDHLDIAVEKV
jgi:hypothetical protein